MDTETIIVIVCNVGVVISQLIILYIFLRYDKRERQRNKPKVNIIPWDEDVP